MKLFVKPGKFVEWIWTIFQRVNFFEFNKTYRIQRNPFSLYMHALYRCIMVATLYACNACVTVLLGSHSESLRWTIDFLDIRRFRFARWPRRGRRAEYGSNVSISSATRYSWGRYALCCCSERGFWAIVQQLEYLTANFEIARKSPEDTRCCQWPGNFSRLKRIRHSRDIQSLSVHPKLYIWKLSDQTFILIANCMQYKLIVVSCVLIWGDVCFSLFIKTE